MNHNKDIEKVLQEIIIELSKEEAPIIFKGAMALKELLYLNNPDIDITRKTRDIDANWIEEYDEERIIDVIDKAVKKVNSEYSVSVYREPAPNKSMGIKVLDKDGSVFTKIDMDIKDNPFYIVCNVDDINIKYSSFDKMMSDKLYSLSSTHVFRRVKDLLDVYLILKDNDIEKESIEKVLKYENRKLDDFDTILNNKEEIEKSYNSLEGIINKPDFDIVWDYVFNYLEKEKFIKLEKNKDFDLER